MALTDSHRQLLVRCSVRNRDGETSVRFIEQNLFRLWQYMMANKHGLQVERVEVSLWLPEHEWQAQHELFQQAGPVEEVKRISFAIYDAGAKLCNTLQRFVLAAEVDKVKGLLLERLPANVKEQGASGDYAMEVEGGYAIIREDIADLASLGQPLAQARSVSGPILGPED
jgi:hypothetical protein